MASSKDRLYNHLYAFFSRYYAGGDFIRQPRRGHEGRYSVAYNGEVAAATASRC